MRQNNSTPPAQESRKSILGRKNQRASHAGASTEKPMALVLELVLKWTLLVFVVAVLVGGVWFLWQGGWPPWAWNGSWGQSFFYNEMSRQSLKSEDLLGAEAFSLKAQMVDPESLDLQFNLGVILAAKKSETEAEAVFRLVEKVAHDPRLKMAARFNLGVLTSQKDEVEKALDWYQKVLEIHPHHKPTQINMELLVKNHEQQQKQQKDKQKKQDQNDQNNQDDQQDQQGQSNQDGSNKKKKDEQDKDSDPKNSDKKQDQDKNSDQKKDQEQNPNPNKDQQSGAKKQPRPFQSQDLDAGDVQKILGELKNQEQRIRAEFQRKNTKEKTREKDW